MSRCQYVWVMASDTPARDQDKFVLRLPDGMRERVRQAAELNRRSMNAEIIARLEESFEGLRPSNMSYEMETLSRMADGSIEKSPYFERIFEKVAHSAAQKAASEVVSFLLESGADEEPPNNAGQTTKLYQPKSTRAPSRQGPTLDEFDDVLRAAGPELAKQVIDKIDEGIIHIFDFDEIISEFTRGAKAASTRERHARLISDLESLVNNPELQLKERRETVREALGDYTPSPLSSYARRVLLTRLGEAVRAEMAQNDQDAIPLTPTPKRPSRAR